MNPRTALIAADLGKARNALVQSPASHQVIIQYQEFLAHDELELACDMLEDYALDVPVSGEFWFALRDAASKMELVDRAYRYEKYSGSTAKD